MAAPAALLGFDRWSNIKNYLWEFLEPTILSVCIFKRIDLTPYFIAMIIWGKSWWEAPDKYIFLE